MRRLLVLALAVFAFTGCNKKEDTTQKAPAAATATDTATPQPKPESPKAIAEKSLNIQEYEQLMLALKDCEITDRGIDRKCKAWEDFDHARKTRGTSLRSMSDQLTKLGEKYITHENTSVRLHAASLIGSMVGASPENQELILKALQSEQNPQVLRTLVRTISSKIAENPAFLESLKNLANHPDENVRVAVNDAFTSTWAAGTEGTLELAMKAVETDSSAKVREQACKRLGNRSEEKVLPLLQKMTEDAEANPKLYAACMNGLIAMWSAPVVPKTPSEAAYNLTMKRLSQTPRTEQLPPWNVMPNLAWASKPQLQAAEPWLKPEELKTLLFQIVVDRNSHWMTRTSAVNTLKRLGTSSEDFEKLASQYQDVRDQPGNEANVLSALEKAAKGEPIFDRQHGIRDKNARNFEGLSPAQIEAMMNGKRPRRRHLDNASSGNTNANPKMLPKLKKSAKQQ